MCQELNHNQLARQGLVVERYIFEQKPQGP